MKSFYQQMVPRQDDARAELMSLNPLEMVLVESLFLTKPTRKKQFSFPTDPEFSSWRKEVFYLFF